MTEVQLIEQAALRVGMKSLMNHGAASCVYSEGCNGVTQEHLLSFAREIALHCVSVLGPLPLNVPAEREALGHAWPKSGFAGRHEIGGEYWTVYWAGWLDRAKSGASKS